MSALRALLRTAACAVRHRLMRRRRSAWARVCPGCGALIPGRPRLTLVKR